MKSEGRIGYVSAAPFTDYDPFRAHVVIYTGRWDCRHVNYVDVLVDETRIGCKIIFEIRYERSISIN